MMNVIGFLGVIFLLTVLFPMAIGLAVRMDLDEALSVLDENGYTAYASPSGDFTVPGNLIAATGRTATYVVAASNAPAHVKAQADYVCDGIADNVEIQAAIDALPGAGGVTRPSGGKVVLSSGTFTLGANVNFGAQHVELVGQGATSTLITCKTALDATMFSFSAANWKTTMRDIAFDGNYANQTSGWILDTSNSYNFLMENCELRYAKDGAIKATTSTEYATFKNVKVEYSPYGFYLNNIQWYAFYDCVATQNNTDGFWVYNSTHLLFLRCTSDQATGTTTRDEGFLIYNSDRVSLIDCDVFGDPITTYLRRGIKLYCDSGISESIRLLNCEVHNVDTSYPAYQVSNAATGYFQGVSILDCMNSGTSDSGLSVDGVNANITCRAEGNNLVGTTAKIVTSVGGFKLRNNVGYVTENSGTATVANTTTSIVVNHGLATTPTRVIISLTNNPTNDPQVWWVDTLTATQFTIKTKVDPGATGAIFNWRAQVGEG